MRRTWRGLNYSTADYSVWRAEKNRAPRAGGRGLIFQEAAVAEFPPIFQGLRIAGLLSPQLLADAGTVAVLDLRVPLLQITSELAPLR